MKIRSVVITLSSWAPAGMGKGRGHLPPPSGNVVKCFCALVITAKGSVVVLGTLKARVKERACNGLGG